VQDVAQYENDLVTFVAARVARPSVLVDCGAEIGMFSMSLFARTKMITRVVAIEPNPHCQEALRANLTSLPVPTEVINGAIGSESGWGTLCTLQADELEYALHMAQAPTGKTRIVSVDELDLPANAPIVLKLDVEGWEGEAVKGARRTLESRDFVITVEANGPVFNRTKIDPCEILKMIPRVRECDLLVAEEPGKPLSLDRAFLEQFPAMMTKSLNVVVSSHRIG
jgi:FkbM family methyltransferase